MTAVQNNVIIFPRQKREDSPVQTMDELMYVIENTKKAVADVIIEEVVGNMFQNFSRYGITVKEKNAQPFMKDVALIVESIKSGVFRSMEFEHPLHDISDKVFEIKSENELKLNLDLLIEKDEDQDELIIIDEEKPEGGDISDE